MPPPDLKPHHVFYLHGFASSPRSTKVGYFSERLREHGVDVRCPDFNQPDFATLTISRMLDQLGAELAQLDGLPATLFGSSLGGTLAILAAERFAPRIDRLVLMAPAVMFAKPGHHLLPPERIDEWQRRGSLPFFHYADNAERPPELHLLRGQPALRRLPRHGEPADADFSGTARRLGRLPHRGSLREHAAGRDAVAARRRPSADCQPAAHVDGHPRVSRARRVTAAREIAIAVAIGFVVQGSGFRVRSGFVVQGAGLSRAQSRSGPGTLNPEPRTLRVGTLKPEGGYAVSDIPMETYVARVLAGEAVRESQPAALEALAITIRTFALANRGRHRADGFDLCDQTHCQVLRAAVAATERAAMVTAGRLLLHDGAPASVYYSASCGGRTQLPSDVWPGADDPSYLPSKDDDACQGAPAWTAELHETDLQRALRASGFRGELRDLRIASANASGRVAKLQLDGLTPAQISGQDFRVVIGRTLGWQHVKSTAFELRKKDGIVPVQRPRLRPRRRPVRHRLRAAGRARGQRRSHPGALLPRIGDFAWRRRPADRGQTRI